MIQDNTQNNKRIAKNTAYLYIRMLFTTVLSLYTARLVLKVLGVEDFGIYNVVGGIVTFMGFLTSTMSSATQRYLTFHLGAGEIDKFKQTFSLLINVHLLFCVAVFVILEIIGPLYISLFMTIPQERITAAQWVFQFSLLTFLLNTVSVPFRSSIIAYEKMGTYAYITVAEAALYLGVVISLAHINPNVDKLMYYGLLMFVANGLIVMWMIFYCIRRLKGCRYIRFWDANYVRELISYSGWNLFGSTTSVMNLQGQAIVLNFFFGPLINAAKAIADKVSGMINQFSQNFYLAVTPQIIKSYSIGDIDYMRGLVLNSSRYSFFLLFVLAVPLLVVMGPLLSLWLGKEQVSVDMVKFSQYTVIYALVNILEQPITMAVRATGNLKKYQIVVGVITLTFIPLCIVIFMMGAHAHTSMILLSCVYLVALFFRVRIVAPIIHISKRDYYISVLKPIICVLIGTIIFLLPLCYIHLSSILDWLIKGLISLFVASVAVFLLGLEKKERAFLVDYLNKILKKK